MTMFDLTEKVAVVTGGGSGLGAASAAALARHGATVVVLDRDRAAAEETALKLGNDSFGLSCDVSDYEQVRSAFTTVAQRCGYVSVLHNNAGVSFNGRGDAPPDELELDMWTHILGINLTGTFLCTKFALPLMTATGRGGSVINMASIAFDVLAVTHRRPTPRPAMPVGNGGHVTTPEGARPGGAGRVPRVR